jgi:aldose 1-epimerase
MSIESRPFGTLSDGRTADLFTITNRNGAIARITNYGAILVALEMPDRQGVLGEITLGFDTLSEYETGNAPYLGVVAGRFANRIAGGNFKLDGVEYQLATNNPPNHLHGGVRGFDKVLWAASLPDGAAGQTVRLEYTSPDGEEGYPGTLDVSVEYTLSDDNALEIGYRASTDRTTIINLTNHTYFNLSAGEAETIHDHEVEIDAEHYTPVDENLIPTGDIESVEGTPLDFREIKPIGLDIDKIKGGYDHNFVLTRAGDYDVRAFDPLSGRTLEMQTTEPGVQFYTGNFLAGISGRDGAVYNSQAGFCLEAQHYPDSPNKPQFPSVVLHPGETYSQNTAYRFSVDR